MISAHRLTLTTSGLKDWSTAVGLLQDGASLSGAARISSQISGWCIDMSNAPPTKLTYIAAIIIAAIFLTSIFLFALFAPKMAEPYSHPADTPPVQMEVLSGQGYECLRVYQGEKELHWQCFQVQP
jgi:hypothetical protein